MLILATITIVELRNTNLFSKTIEARNKYKKSAEEENNKLDDYANKINEVTKDNLVKSKNTEDNKAKTDNDTKNDELINDGLLAHYTFDSVNNNIISDKSANNYNLTVNGSQIEEGKLKCVSGYATAENPIIPTNGTFAISVWFKINTLGSNNTNAGNNIILSTVYGYNPYEGSAYWTNGLGLGCRGSNNQITGIVLCGNRNATSFGCSLNLNTWYHLVINEVGGNASAYINGTILGTKAYIAPTAHSYNLHVGYMQESGSYNVTLGGYLDNLRIYNRNLTTNEILALYNNQI